MNQASFNIYPQLLAVQFTDTSVLETGITISSWAWDFGVSPAATSTSQNPSYTYTTAGKYLVSLTITDSNGDTLQALRYIMVSTSLILPVTIEDLVKIKLPVGFTFQPAQLSANIAIWQLYIQPLINSPGVAEGSAFDETAYPPIINALIAYIVTYQIILDYVSGAAISGAGSGIGGTDAMVKRIETGPSNAEFQNNTDYLKYLNGLLDLLKTQMCMLASRSKIGLPYCPPLPMPKFIPLKAGRNDPSLLNIWELDPADVLLTY